VDLVKLSFTCEYLLYQADDFQRCLISPALCTNEKRSYCGWNCQGALHGSWFLFVLDTSCAGLSLNIIGSLVSDCASLICLSGATVLKHFVYTPLLIVCFMTLVLLLFLPGIECFGFFLDFPIVPLHLN
jgi:hypothetical protein